MDDLECQRLLREALTLMQSGDERGARRTWQRVLAARPDEPAALDGLAQSLFRSGQWTEARQLFARLTQLKPSVAIHWIQKALCCEQLGQVDEQEQCLSSAREADPHDLLALLLRGDLLERLGRRHEAQRAYAAAAAVAPPMDQLHPQLRPALSKALAFLDHYQAELAAFMDASLSTVRSTLGGEDLARIDLSLDIFLGRKRRFESRPERYFVPNLLPIEFFPRERFGWMDAIEAQTDRIREEFHAVLAQDAGWQPYIQYGRDQPLAQWQELNHSRRWSAFHLWKDGVPLDANLMRCPVTASALQHAPRPQQPGRTPVALFSLLQPRTRIPPHVGASNARLLCHLPLVVPPGCRFRVGNTTREWVEGQAWVFDDTIEHEAWNDSDQLRVVLIWDIWHPDLSEAERLFLTTISQALHGYAGGDAGYAA